MLLKIIYFGLGLFFAHISIVFAQIPDSAQIKISAEWLGIWKGKMTLQYASGTSQVIDNELHIQKISDKLWAWRIVYDDGKNRQERAYELLVINSLKGKYQIDEKNSIILNAYFADNTLMSVFTVEKNQIFTTYRLQNDTLYFENIMVRSDQPTMTGGQGETPKVESFPVRVLQRGVLKKN
jgi:hypothetical protein